MLTVAVQAGGASSRMGQDKALIPFLGQPLIQRVCARLRPIAEEMFVTTGRLADYSFLSVPLFFDASFSHGPLSGLYTSLLAANQSLVAFVACDMPFVNPELLAYQAKVLEDEAADIVIPLSKGGYEPLHAVYRRETCLPAVEWALENAQWKLIGWFSKVRARTLNFEECRQIDPTGLAFTNINTPQELAEAEELARRAIY